MGSCATMKPSDSEAKSNSESSLPKAAQWPGATTTPPMKPPLDHPTSSALLANPAIEDEYRNKYHYEIDRKTRKLMSQESFPSNRFGVPSTHIDPACDPEHPVVVTGERVLDATHRIKGGVLRTACSLSKMSNQLGMQLYLKKDYLQKTGSFKERGARYSVIRLSEDHKKNGVITTSAGNHAQALAWHGRDLGVPVTVIMPRIAPQIKVDNCREMGAEVLLHGMSFDEARDFAMNLAKERQLLYINGFDHPDIIAGQGSIGIEILEDVPDVDYVIVPIGGGGMVAGITAAIKHLKPEVKVIGVESERCPSWQTRRLSDTHTKCMWSAYGAKNSIADGLAVAEVGCNAFATCDHHLEKVISITEDWIAIAILRLLEKEKAVTEGGGAAGVAAIIANALPELKGKKVCTVLCGGNIDASTLTRVIDRGLIAEGRMCRFTVVVTDRPGGMAEMLALIAENGGSIKEVQHDRILLTAFVYKVALVCTIETRSDHHATLIHEKLEERFKKDLTWHTVSAEYYGDQARAEEDVGVPLLP